MESRLFITPAFAQGAPAGGGMEMILQFVPFVLIFVIMWFLIIRPQQRRVKTHQEMIKNVRRGDTVVTSGGIIGKVTKVTEDSADIEVEIAEREGEGGPGHDFRRPLQERAGQGLIDEEAGPPPADGPVRRSSERPDV